MFKCLILVIILENIHALEMRNMNKCVPTIEMLDASGKLPSGIKTGNMIDLGAFDECLSIDYYNINTTTQVKGKYCLVKFILQPNNLDSTSTIIDNNAAEQLIQLNNRALFNIMDPSTSPNTSALIFGWCIPSTCEINQYIQLVTDYLQLPNGTIKPLLNTGFCQTKNDLYQKWTLADCFVIAFLILTLVIIIASTIYDTYLHKQQKEPIHKLAIAFSVLTNGRKLLSVSTNPEQLACLHGIRFLSMLWIIFGHRHAVIFLEPIINFLFIEQWEHQVQNMFIINAPIAVDTFFLLSGLLLTYGLCLAREKSTHFNIITFYLHRYIRLTPALAVVVLIHATILDRFGSGPLWPFLMTQLKDVCVQYWWTTITYIENYYNTASMCITQSWYLSVDMQLYILSPLLLIPLWKWTRSTLCAIVALLLISIIVPALISWQYDLPVFTIEAITNNYYNSVYYYSTHTRYGTWLIGFLFGHYIYHQRKSISNTNRNSKLHPGFVCFCWIIAIMVMLLTIFGGHQLLFQHNRLSQAFFNGLHRHAWACALCWIIYACTQGYGSIINAFLSLSIFQILSRFTYTMYLLHLSMQYMSASVNRTNMYFSELYAMHEFAGDFCFTLFLAMCFTLAFESPMLVIEKIIFNTKTRTKNNGNETGQRNQGFVND